jgi:hypothetical protein
MSILSYLTELSSRLVLSENEKASINTSIATLQQRLAGWQHIGSFGAQYIFGSYAMDTILPRRFDNDSDVDYMIVFEDENRIKPQTYLNWLKDFCESKYKRSEIYQSYPTIALELNHIRFELVPAIAPYGVNQFLQIPAPRENFVRWINTDPNKLNNQIIESNRRNYYLVKPTIRLVKYWNALNGKHIPSYYIENTLSSLAYPYCRNLEDMFFAAARYLPDFIGWDNGKKYTNQFKEKAAEIEYYKCKGDVEWANYLLITMLKIE